MALKKESKAVADVLTSEDNAELSAEEVADKVIDALDAVRREATRFFAVFQINGERGVGAPFILGPYSTYKRAVQGGELGTRGAQELSQLGLTHRHMVGIGVNGTALIPQHYQPCKEESQFDRTIKVMDARRDEAKAIMREMHEADWSIDDIAAAYGCSKVWVRVVVGLQDAPWATWTTEEE